MALRRLGSIITTVIVLCSLALAQVPQSEAEVEKAKQKKELEERLVEMLDAVVAESNGLRLAGNRAVVLALAGDLYWRFDSTRARELFRTASAEIASHNQEFEREKREETDIRFADPMDSNDPRTDILNLIATRDADLALELMIPTRSISLSDAMAKSAVTLAAGVPVNGTPVVTIAGSGIGPGVPSQSDSMDRARAAQEIAMEERFRMQAAFSDPERAIKAIEESIAKGISTSVISLLQVVFRRDEKKATDLGGDFVSKITATDLTKNSADMNGAIGFLQFVSRPPAPSVNAKTKVFAFTDSQIKDVANKLANTFLQPGNTPTLSASLTRALPMLEKLLPERIAILKQRDAQNRKASSTARGRNAQGPARFFDSNTPLEDVLAQAARQPNERDRLSAYQAVASRIGQVTDDAKAKKLLDQIPDEKIRANALKQFESGRIARLTQAEKMDEARRAINQLTDKKIKVQRLVQLAGQYQRKGGEAALESAKEIMTEVKTLVNPFPEDEDELADLMEAIRGYATVEPNAAFLLIEPLMDQFNEVIQASAVLSKYNKRDRGFKKGELLMRVNGNNSGLISFRYLPQIQMLARTDVERMYNLVDKFQRSDSRTLMRLFVLQGYIRAQPLPRTTGM